ncbi:MAG: type II toxin-antitoxin system VapC family toxin [Desulfovermiculus sp.]
MKQALTGKKVLIDSNIIIYLTEEIEPYCSLAREVFSLVEEGGGRAVISILSISEVMQGPLRAGMIEAAIAVKDYLTNFPNSICQHITSDVLDLVGRDQRVNWETLRTMDSLIIASGLHAHVDLFLSNDQHFARSLPTEMLLSLTKSSDT